MPEPDTELVHHAITQATSALNELRELARYYDVTRQRGHTAAMVVGARQSGALILAADEAHARHFTAQGLPAVSRIRLASGLVGRRTPLLVDHWALQQMIADAHRALANVTTELVRTLTADGGPRG